MSTSVSLPVDDNLDSDFKKATNSEDPPRCFVVVIQEEKLICAKTIPGTSKVDTDYDALSTIAAEEGKEGGYFLFRKGNDNKEWLIITYVPETVSVKSKMTFASAKSQLKAHLGVAFFSEEVHTTSADELKYSVYSGNSKPVESRSSEEILREKINNDEEKERTEREKQHAASPSGYHSLAIPFSEDARASIAKFKSGQVNFVILKIDSDKKEVVDIVESKQVSSVAEVAKNFSTTEPRFYLYAFGTPTVNVFLYCCPEKSPVKMRLVYSTAKPKAAEEIEKNMGVVLAPKKIEMRDPEDLTDAFLRDELKTTPKTVADVKASSPKPPPNLMTGRLKSTNMTGVQEMGGTVKASKPTTSNTASHPVYSLMTGKASSTDPPGPTTATKKKIVIPPKGAW